MSNDPWKHRSANMTCKTCMYFVVKESGTGKIKIGRCRKNAPTREGYPVVFPQDWCGVHKLDEDKI